MTRRESCSVTERGDYELVPQLDEDSYDEEEECQLILEEEEVPYLHQSQGCDVPMTPRTLLEKEVRPKSLSQCFQQIRIVVHKIVKFLVVVLQV